SLITAAYDAQDRLTQYGATAYNYTANGELLSKITSGQTTQYNYDVVGNLSSVTLPDGTKIDYLVDGQNRRIGKKVNGVKTKGFLYQNQLNVVGELDANNNLVNQFVYASRKSVPDFMIKGDFSLGNFDIFRIICDQLGSPRLVVNV